MPAKISPNGRARRILAHIERLYPWANSQLTEPQRELLAKYIASEFKSQREADRMARTRAGGEDAA